MSADTPQPPARKLGWRVDLENIPRLVVTSKRFLLTRAFAAPREVDHRGWLTVENQRNMGSCAGHARSTCGEICNWLDSGGQVIQLSRMFSYLTAQRVSGITGDSGATIEGAIEAAKKYGECLESTFPYPSQYTSQIPQSAFTEAAAHKLLNHSSLSTYDEVFAWLASGVGPVFLGILWTSSFSDAGATVEQFSGQELGGHAIAFTGYTQRKQGSRNYIILSNSHGKEWGAQGHTEVAPSVIDALMRHQFTVMIGVSDLEEYQPRTYDLI